MTLQPPPRSGVNGPLWLIAFSLLTIAICLVFMVIDKQIGAPKEASRAETKIQDPPAAPRPERLRLNPGSSPRRADPFGDLALSQTGATTGSAAPDAPPNPTPGFLPTSAGPLPGGYLPALPRIIGQPNYRTVVKGRVILKGTPPPEKETPVPADYPCPPPEPPVLKTRFFVLGTNGGLANTIVYFSPRETKSPPQLSNETNELVFTDCRLEPAFSIVVPGQSWRARDTLGLNHEMEGVTSNPQDTIEIAAGSSVLLPSRVASKTPVTVKCKLHPWETAQVGFAAPRFMFTITDRKGEFSVTNVPPGEYDLDATHWSGTVAQTSSQRISVRPGRTNSVDLVIQAPATETAAQF